MGITNFAKKSLDEFDRETWLAKLDALGIASDIEQYRELLHENPDDADPEKLWLEYFIEHYRSSDGQLNGNFFESFA